MKQTVVTEQVVQEQALPHHEFRDLNYPFKSEPFNLIHFDLEEIKVELPHHYKFCLLMHISFIILMSALVFNVFSSTFFAVLGEKPIVQIILSILATIGFSGYAIVSMKSALHQLTNYHFIHRVTLLIGEIIFTIASLNYSLSAKYHFNGWFGIGNHQLAISQIMVVIESILWLMYLGTLFYISFYLLTKKKKKNIIKRKAEETIKNRVVHAIQDQANLIV